MSFLYKHTFNYFIYSWKYMFSIFIQRVPDMPVFWFLEKLCVHLSISCRVCVREKYPTKKKHFSSPLIILHPKMTQLHAIEQCHIPPLSYFNKSLGEEKPWENKCWLCSCSTLLKFMGSSWEDIINSTKMRGRLQTASCLQKPIICRAVCFQASNIGAANF